MNIKMTKREIFDSVINKFKQENQDLDIDNNNLNSIWEAIKEIYSDDIVIKITMHKGYSEMLVFDPCLKIKDIYKSGIYPLFVKNDRL